MGDHTCSLFCSPVSSHMAGTTVKSSIKTVCLCFTLNINNIYIIKYDNIQMQWDQQVLLETGEVPVAGFGLACIWSEVVIIIIITTRVPTAQPANLSLPPPPPQSYWLMGGVTISKLENILMILRLHHIMLVLCSASSPLTVMLLWVWAVGSTHPSRGERSKEIVDYKSISCSRVQSQQVHCLLHW